MDYRKKSTIAELNRLTSPGRKVSSKLNVWTFRLVLVVFIAIILFGTMAVLGVCKGIIDTAPDIDTIDVSPEGYSTKIYDTDGNVEILEQKYHKWQPCVRHSR